MPQESHLARVCRTTSQSQTTGRATGRQQHQQFPGHQSQQTRNNLIQGETDADEDEEDELPLLRVGGKARQPIVVTMTVR